jgi:ribose transport system substrate-binding protein
VVGFDAIPEAVEAIRRGALAASVAQNPFAMGDRAIRAACRAIRGEPVEGRIDTGTTLVTGVAARPRGDPGP